MRGGYLRCCTSARAAIYSIRQKRWTEDTRLLQKLAITVTHPFRRIRSFEDCLADEEVHCELLSEAAVYALGRFTEER
jgi:hypothetical protein